MRRPHILVVAGIAAACAPSPGAHPEPNERDARRPAVADSVAHAMTDPAVEEPTHRAGDMRGLRDLSGAWATGSTNEPAVPRIVIQLSCNYTPAAWMIEQSGDSVWSWRDPESRAQGIARPIPPRPVRAEGRIVDGTITMSGGGARYVLRYDSTSGHLRGTLNDAPFWAVREQRIPATGCIPVP